MAKTLTLNGIDVTDVLTPTGYTVSYKKVRGPNSGQMMDGSYTDDVLTTKAVVTAICMPTNEENLSQLLALLAETYLTAYYFDPRAKAYRTVEVMPGDPEQKYRGKGSDLLDYWTGTIIQLTER